MIVSCRSSPSGCAATEEERLWWNRVLARNVLSARGNRGCLRRCAGKDRSNGVSSSGTGSRTGVWCSSEGRKGIWSATRTVRGRTVRGAGNITLNHAHKVAKGRKVLINNLIAKLVLAWGTYRFPDFPGMWKERCDTLQFACHKLFSTIPAPRFHLSFGSRSCLQHQLRLPNPAASVIAFGLSSLAFFLS